MTDTKDHDQKGVEQGDWRIAVVDAAQAVANHMVRSEARERREANWRKLKRGVFIGLALGAMLSYGMFIRSLAGTPATDPDPTTSAVAVIPIEGEISGASQASADKVAGMLERACGNAKVKIVLLDINSPGGSPTEAERMVAAINQCRATHHKPIYALIRQMGASAAYMVAMHTDRVYAGKYSVVGSIGAIMRYLDASDAAARFGLTEHVFRSGVLKGGVSTWSKTSAEDAALNTEMVKAMGAAFVEDLFATRGPRLHASREEIASGRVWTSDQALAMGLIDKQAVLEELKTTEFKGLKVSRYDSRPPVTRLLGLEETLRSVLSDVLQPRFE
ncbi:S49 family peptidase [Rhodanobacter denitrificans]|uniref:S49 family peptidase n=1 Tax=Rhodanobacter denitrificans TaxID=666685 RepID=UPI001F2DCD72|nr:S49 family peptidase [Rhodanobacter denitrificans]UJJ60594.1 S49 family peptidase [Rhodanobacter denitrificans]